MPEDRSIDILDYLVILLKWKKFLIVLFIVSFALSYLTIYFFVDEEYDSSGLIIPSNNSTLGSISGIMKNLKDLPLGLGGSTSSAETNLYLTLIYSRSNLLNLIHKFNLMKDYNLTSVDKTVEALQKKITASLNKQDAFEITVRANSPTKASQMVDYLLDYINNKVIELNVSKAKENREFLESRYLEVSTTLKNSEGYVVIASQQGIYRNTTILDIDSKSDYLNNPKEFLLSQNYPNPFNPSTKISWQSPVSGWQTLKVYDVLGNEVAILVNAYRSAGSYEIEFNPSSIKHLPASGVYFYRLQAGDYVETKKMIFLK